MPGTLDPCDDILIIDHGSDDGTLRVANEYGARITQVDRVAAEGLGRLAAGRKWILCLDARESLTEVWRQAWDEWKTESPGQSAFAMFIREETVAGWIENPTPQTRLVPAAWNQWEGKISGLMKFPLVPSKATFCDSFCRSCDLSGRRQEAERAVVLTGIDSCDLDHFPLICHAIDCVVVAVSG